MAHACAAAPDAPSARPGTYVRRQPEKTVLYRTVLDHRRSFLDEIRADEGERSLPAFVVDEVEAFLRCGILAHGFVRSFCDGCKESRLVAFSCKRRGFCPSCIGRRMCDYAAHLCDDVMPRVPVRQWVLTVPHRLRFQMAFDPNLTGVVLRTFVAVVSAWLRKRARAMGIKGTLKTGGTTVIQRFGSALNLNVHFHTLMIDGVYRLRLGGPPVFHPVPSPTDEEVARIVAAVRRKVMRKLERLDATAAEAATEAEPLLASLANASVAGRVATGPRRGARVARVVGPHAVEAEILSKRCAFVEG